jgi:hypothetical protein
MENPNPVSWITGLGLNRILFTHLLMVPSSRLLLMSVDRACAILSKYRHRDCSEWMVSIVCRYQGGQRVQVTTHVMGGDIAYLPEKAISLAHRYQQVFPDPPHLHAL